MTETKEEKKLNTTEAARAILRKMRPKDSLLLSAKQSAELSQYVEALFESLEPYERVGNEGETYYEATEESLQAVNAAFVSKGLSMKEAGDFVTAINAAGWHTVTYSFVECKAMLHTSGGIKRELTAEEYGAFKEAGSLAEEQAALGVNSRHIIPLEWQDLMALKNIGDIAELLEQKPQQSLTLQKPTGKYRLMVQGNLTNTLATMSSTQKAQQRQDLSGNAIIEKDGITLTIAHALEQTALALDNNAHALHEFLLTKFTEGGRQSDIISFTWREYMELCGLKDAKNAKEQVKKALASLHSFTLQAEDSKTGGFLYLSLLDASGGGTEYGGVKVKLGSSYAEFLRSSDVRPMYLHEARWGANPRTNPHTGAMIRYLCLDKRRNENKANISRKGIASVKAIMAACPQMPQYDEMTAERRRQARQLIIEPFERDMDEAEKRGAFKWEYCHKNGTPLTDDELQRMDYATFSALNVKYVLLDYPKVNGKEHKPKRRRGRPKKSE